MSKPVTYLLLPVITDIYSSLQAHQLLVEATRKKLGLTSTEWQQADYILLGASIQAATGQHLSSHTLKHVISLQDDNTVAYISTLNYICIYLGYSDWADFKMKAQAGILQQVETRDQSGRKIVTEKGIPYLIIILVTGMLVLMAVGFWFISDKLSDKGMGVIEATPINKGVYPQKVIFSYYLPNIKLNNLNVIRYEKHLEYLNYDDDGRGTSTHIFNEPGIYKIKIFSNKETLAEKKLMLPSDGWINNVSASNKGIFTLDRSSLAVGKLHIPYDTVTNYIGNTRNWRYWTSFYKVEKFGVDMDNFNFAVRLQNKPMNPSTRTGDTYVYLNGEKNNIKIHLAIPNRSLGHNGKLSETNLFVKDFPGLMYNTAQPFEFQIINKDKDFRLLLNGQEVIHSTYDEPLGDLIAIKFGFLGSGMADSLRVKNGKGHIVYIEDF